jgi:hypothetical protein
MVARPELSMLVSQPSALNKVYARLACPKPYHACPSLLPIHLIHLGWEVSLFISQPYFQQIGSAIRDTGPFVRSIGTNERDLGRPSLSYHKGEAHIGTSPGPKLVVTNQGEGFRRITR